jgi:nitrite reductase (NADH) small subunit
LHNWNIALATGEAQGEDKGCTPVIPVKIDGGRVLICRASTLKAAA